MKTEVNVKNAISTDDELVRQAQKNSEEFRPLYEKYYRLIFLFILHRVEEKALAADLTSQVFLKALVKISTYQFKGLPFSAWLYRIAINECHDFFRRTKRHRLVVLEDETAETLYEEMFGQEHLEELKQKLPHILERLKPEELQLIELRFMEEKSFKEVAEILGITENYAKVRTYRILDKMKSLFARKK